MARVRQNGRFGEVKSVESGVDVARLILLIVHLEFAKRKFRRRRCRRVKNREGEGGGGGGQIILSPPKARNFLVCSKFGFIRSLGLFEV